MTVAAALVVAAGCAALLAAGRLGTAGSSPSSSARSVCASPCGPSAGAGGGPTPGVRVPAAPEQHQGRSLPASSAAPPAAASSAPISASALVKFKVTSHWDDGYRAAVTITNRGAAPLTSWHLTFQLTGATLHQPPDTDETAMSGREVGVTPDAWHATLAAGAAVTFGFGFDGTLATPTDCRLDGAPCELQYVAPGQ